MGQVYKTVDAMGGKNRRMNFLSGMVGEQNEEKFEKQKLVVSINF